MVSLPLWPWPQGIDTQELSDVTSITLQGWAFTLGCKCFCSRVEASSDLLEAVVLSQKVTSDLMEAKEADADLKLWGEKILSFF